MRTPAFDTASGVICFWWMVADAVWCGGYPKAALVIMLLVVPAFFVTTVIKSIRSEDGIDGLTELSTFGWALANYLWIFHEMQPTPDADAGVRIAMAFGVGVAAAIAAGSMRLVQYIKSK